MPRLRVRTGCRTCLIRRKKCDEAYPTCRECSRLNLACVPRSVSAQRSTRIISLTNMRAKSPCIKTPVSNGYPPFRNDLEKKLTEESPTIFHPLLSRLGDPSFRDFKLFGRFCTQSLLVREALVAFAAYGRGLGDPDTWGLSLTSYQSCISRLKDDHLYQVHNFDGRDLVLTTIMFLGLLEGLRLGNPAHCIAHFEACRRILATILEDPTSLKDPTRQHLYRIVAECVIYNLATMSPFEADICETTQDWGDSFDCLFWNNDRFCSPFLGGYQKIYHAMFQTNRLLRRVQLNLKNRHHHELPKTAFNETWQEIHQLEQQLPKLCSNSPNHCHAKNLYNALHHITLYAQKLHLIKISRTSASTSDSDVKCCVSQSISVLKQQDVRLPGNPALRWPLTILACAVEIDEDFEFLQYTMLEIEKLIDPSNSQKIRSALSLLGSIRRGESDKDQSTSGAFSPSELAFNLLLEPCKLNNY